MSRDTFLQRVREAAAIGRAYRVHAPALPDRVGYSGAGADPAARMAAEVEAAGGHAHLVADLPAARAALAQLLDRYAPQSALCWQHPLLERLGLNELLASRGIDRTDHGTLSPCAPAEQRSRMLAADIGITSADFAVAETGTLAVASCPGQERSASLLPPVHIALIERSQILPDLFDLFDRMEQLCPGGVQNLASNWTLITGPSKTGDLELTLTTGVHGPGTWHVIVIKE